MNDLMRKETPNEWGLKELQNVILNIAYDIDKFCQKHNITYRLMGGSALGAKRHGGFIPWDDDLDVFMTPDEYEQFRDAFNKDGDKEKYYLQELGASEGKVITAKVRLNNSYFEEDIIKDWHVHQGVCGYFYLAYMSKQQDSALLAVYLGKICNCKGACK